MLSKTCKSLLKKLLNVNSIMVILIISLLVNSIEESYPDGLNSQIAISSKVDLTAAFFPQIIHKYIIK